MLFLNGVIVQILKHLIGRARPNYTNIDAGTSFSFFTNDSNFHSFPSGHASTIFVLALLFSIAVPRLKYFFIAFAVIVSFSRVAVGAHFLTDIIGGSVIAFVSYKILDFVYEKKFINNKPIIINYINNNLYYLILFVFFLFVIALTVEP